MVCTLGYGRQGLPVSLPDDWDVTVLSKRHMPALPDPAAGIRAALASPMGSGPLREEAQGCATACILICDITRPVPNALALRPMVEELLAAGMKARISRCLSQRDCIVPARNRSRSRSSGIDWVRATFGAGKLSARSDADQALVGTTRQGIPVRLDSRFLEADVRIAVGLVEPHFMAGWSGGRKLILPGIAHADTITRFPLGAHAGRPRAVTCGLRGNPLHEAQMEALGMVGRALSMNMVIDEDSAALLCQFRRHPGKSRGCRRLCRSLFPG